MWSFLGVPAVVLAYAAYASAWPSARRWGPSIHRLPVEDRLIALTFDDGPSNDTPFFLDALDALRVRATFFLCGANVERRPEVAQAIVKAGHAVGNHTYTHPRLPRCSPGRVRQELAATQEVIEDTTGLTPKWFRPPYGLRAISLTRLLPELDLVGVHWTVSGRDWRLQRHQIAHRVIKQATPGGIICLHDGDTVRPHADRRETLEAVKQIVPHLQDLGYRFVSLDEAQFTASPEQAGAGRSY